MKMYNKPEIFVTEFVPNEAVTVCPWTNTYTYDPQNISCVIDGSEWVFGSNCVSFTIGDQSYTGVNVNAASGSNTMGTYEYSNDVNGVEVTQDWDGDGADDDGLYFIWKKSSSSSGGRPGTGSSNTGTANQQSLLQAIVTGWNSDLSGGNPPAWAGYHAGRATATITSAHNHS